MPATPDYVRISDEITADVRSGKYKPGDRLPSIAEQCVQYNTSPSTINLVNVRLEALGVIVRRQGKGIFVTDPKTWLRKP
ncbi:winged helix-turn-helix transcriptional regulator [Plantactinospora sp. S1510]|uniref:Winged helix-turn-helix transcriptional regulator n=1 Tax=Plantactinospora alkalitolerans TaxID=2789879 RepID=A0ABS0H9D2_9ACTN|nr:winged helix-turn-helix domain-containing protein [Plantactinospora alkalitolerans]MBF9135085.1 winged helix-turn-helix transcriptional regulator [Plantactinospora alkalitolerans]